MAVTEAEMCRVILDIGANHVSSTKNVASGTLRRKDGAHDAIIVISGEYLTTHGTVRAEIMEAVELLDLVHPIARVDVIALFGSKPANEWIEISTDILYGVISRYSSPKAQWSGQVMYFINEGRTLFVSASADRNS